MTELAERLLGESSDMRTASHEWNRGVVRDIPQRTLTWVCGKTAFLPQKGVSR